MLDEKTLTAEDPQKKELNSLLKKDLRYLMVFLMAGMKPQRHMDELEDLFTESVLGKAEFRALRNSLLKHGYWALDSQGFIHAKKEHIDLGDLSLHEFTNMTLNLLTRVSEDGPCNCENLFVVTNEALKREFYQSINKALKTLVEKSKQVHGDRLVAWTHIGIDCGSPDKIIPAPLFS